jgi:6-phosphogluconolactonase
MKWYVSGVVLLVLVFSASQPALPSPPSGKQQNAQRVWVFVGTYTGGQSKGIYRLELDTATGKLGEPDLAGSSVNPSFLAIHPNRRFLYAVNEIDNFRKGKTGAVSAFTIDSKTGDLSLLNQQATEGDGPCHLVVDRLGKHVLAANYGGGSVCVLPIFDDGRLGPASCAIQHRGSSVNKQRQEAPHAHSVNLDSANRFAFVADLGIDKVLIYRFDAGKGILSANQPPSVSVMPGAGPRHFTIHPHGRSAYVINELHSTVSAFDYDADKGELKKIQTVSTLPAGYSGKSFTAEVVVHPTGKFLYGSNRGHNSIAIFTIDPKTGKLSPAGFQTDKINTPRNFAIDPSGTFLLVANQAGDSIVVFRIDQKTGELSPTRNSARVARPVCLRMMPRPPR